MKRKTAELLAKGISLCLDLIFPPRCVFCGEVVPPGAQVCRKCGEEMIPSGKAEMMFLFADRAPVACTWLYAYEGRARDSMLDFKFHGQKKNGAYYAEKLAAQTAIVFPGKTFDAVVCVPLSAERRKERGYDQSEQIALPLAEKLGIPFLPALRKIRKNKVQHLLGREERAENVRGAYAVAESCSVAGKKLLLVDDIVTTGSTLRECAQVLLRGGAASVACAAAAKAEPGRVEKDEPV